jgi:hypothetical protein
MAAATLHIQRHTVGKLMTELDSGPAHQPPAPAFVNEEHDARDPNQWLTLYLDVSVSINETVKHAWLHDGLNTEMLHAMLVQLKRARKHLRVHHSQ